MHSRSTVAHRATSWWVWLAAAVVPGWTPDKNDSQKWVNNGRHCNSSTCASGWPFLDTSNAATMGNHCTRRAAGTPGACTSASNCRATVAHVASGKRCLRRRNVDSRFSVRCAKSTSNGVALDRNDEAILDSANVICDTSSTSSVASAVL